MAEKRALRVVIVGGGIGGLALACCLQHTGVDFMLIERRDRLDPQTGASIGILPNGARILDQIGCYEDLLEVTATMKTTASHRHDGSLIGRVSDTLQLMQKRTGYAVIFLDRQILLRILANHILDCKRIVLGKSVRAVEQTPDKAVVTCSDGSSIEADIVVGADGTYSFVRQEMWRNADLTGQGWLFENDKQAMSAEYMCLFGISARIDGMETGQTDRTYAKDMSTLSYVGKDGRIFWFVFAKMDQVYRYPSIPRYTDGDAAALVQRLGHLAIRERGIVTVRDLYSSRLTCQLVAIEEAAYRHWSHGRIVCLGDSIHKMTANLGAGASSALESAAALSNVLAPLTAGGTEVSLPTLQDAFQRYQASRSLRVGRAMAFSNSLTRVQALKGTHEYIYTHYIAPRSEDSAVETFSSFVIGAEKVDHLPIPGRSLNGTMPFNPRQGWGFGERRAGRIQKALPLAFLSLFAFCLTFTYSRQFCASLDSSHGEQSVLTTLATMVTEDDVLYGIWLIEAIRSINTGTVLQFSTLIGITALHVGYPILGPLYLFLLYVCSPIENFRASDNRLTDMSYTVAVIPLLAVFCILPKILLLWPSTYGTAIWMIRYKPYLIGALESLLANSLIPRTKQNDRLRAVRRDVAWIRVTFRLLLAGSLLSRVCWLAAIIRERDGHDSWHLTQTVNATAFSASVIAWLLLVLGDFQSVGMSNLRWPYALFLCLTLTLSLGPGVLLGAGWLWREEILANRRHKDAIV